MTSHIVRTGFNETKNNLILMKLSFSFEVNNRNTLVRRKHKSATIYARATVNRETHKNV